MSDEKSFFIKLDDFFSILAECNNSVIAYSGGVDSSFLAKAAQKITLERVVCVLLNSPLLTREELIAARNTAKEIGLPLIELESRETEIPDFVRNDAERCYYCKKYRLELISAWAKQNGYDFVLEGSNADDLNDYRPGMKAAAEFDNVKSPLLQSGLTKKEIREKACQWGLSVWSKPSLPCLATRISYGTELTQSGLNQVQAAEQVVASYCPDSGNVRVRVYDGLARIEIDKEHLAVLAQSKVADEIDAKLKELGFKFVTLDLAGFSSGSMNKSIVG